MTSKGRPWAAVCVTLQMLTLVLQYVGACPAAPLFAMELDPSARPPPERSTAGWATHGIGMYCPVGGGWKSTIEVSSWVSPEACPPGLQEAAFSLLLTLSFSFSSYEDTNRTG